MLQVTCNMAGFQSRRWRFWGRRGVVTLMGRLLRWPAEPTLQAAAVVACLDLELMHVNAVEATYVDCHDGIAIVPSSS